MEESGNTSFVPAPVFSGLWALSRMAILEPIGLWALSRMATLEPTRPIHIPIPIPYPYSYPYLYLYPYS